ncbi:MAG: SlyX family protein [Desulforhopalus sp.]
MDRQEEISLRLRVLEEKYAYQDQTIDSLNEVLIEQQKQLTALAEEVERLKGMLQMVESGSPGHLTNPPPPHY